MPPRLLGLLDPKTANGLSFYFRIIMVHPSMNKRTSWLQPASHLWALLSATRSHKVTFQEKIPVTPFISFCFAWHAIFCITYGQFIYRKWIHRYLPLVQNHESFSNVPQSDRWKEEVWCVEFWGPFSVGQGAALVKSWQQSVKKNNASWVLQ